MRSLLVFLFILAMAPGASGGSLRWEAGSVPALPVFVVFTAPRLGHYGYGNFISGVSYGGWNVHGDRLLLGTSGIGIMAENDPNLAQRKSLRLFNSVQPVLFSGVGIRVMPRMRLSVNVGRTAWFGQQGYWHVWTSMSIGR